MPDNVVAAFASSNMLQVIIFAIFVGVTIALISDTKAGKSLSNFFESESELMSKMIGIVMKVAPIGVFALIANVTGRFGTMALQGIGKLLFAQYTAYAIVLVVVFPIILKLVARVSPFQHYKNIFSAMLMALSTQSSSATLPTTMKCTKERCGVPEDIVNLIAAPAATINMQGCAAEMAIYAVFASQIYGLGMGLGQLSAIALLGVFLAAGIAGVPGGAIMMASVLLEIMGLPLDIVPWIAGVYVLIDIPNTMLNVTGDTVGMVYTASKLGELKLETYNASNAEFVNEQAG